MPRSEWEKAAPLLARALEEGLDIEQVREEVEAGRAQLWTTPNSAAVCGVQVPLGVREYHIWLAGGDLSELKVLEKSVCAYAHALGCVGVIIHGRRGWLRALPGYQPGRTIKKELP